MWRKNAPVINKAGHDKAEADWQELRPSTDKVGCDRKPPEAGDGAAASTKNSAPIATNDIAPPPEVAENFVNNKPRIFRRGRC